MSLPKIRLVIDIEIQTQDLKLTTEELLTLVKAQLTERNANSISDFDYQVGANALVVVEGLLPPHHVVDSAGFTVKVES